MSQSEPIALLPTADERTLALLAHILQIVASWLAPLIIMLVKRDSRFVSFHALQALLLQLAYFVVMAALVVFWFFMVFFFSMTPSSHVPSPAPFFFPMFFLLWVGPWITMIVLAIVYGMKANQGEWAEYPVVGVLARRILKI